MASYRILIADDDQQHLTQVSNFFSEQEQINKVDVAMDGWQALEKLRESSYDAVLMDLIMPKLDGFGVLEQYSCASSGPAVIIVSAIRSEGMIRNACSLGARYFMLKPVEPQMLYRRVMDMLETPALVDAPVAVGQRSRSLDEKIAEVFLVAGIPAHIKGYHYLREGIRMVFQTPDLINQITKGLYPGIALRFDTSASKVERAIRHAIEVAWARGKIENLNQLFGYNIYSKNDKPTNGEFIALVADKMLMEQVRGQDMQTMPLAMAR